MATMFLDCFGTPTFLEVHYDGVKVMSNNPLRSSTITLDTNGYPVVPQVPEWLWLSVGASFGDGDFQSKAVGTLSDALSIMFVFISRLHL